MSSNVNILALLFGITPEASERFARSQSSSPGLYSYVADSKVALERLLFGYHVKTKRSLSEEAESGDETSVYSWIHDGVDPDALDVYGYTPLLNAAALGRLNAVYELIRNGANVDKKGPFGLTPLHAAAQNGNREVVSLLLKSGAEINAQNDDQDTAMHLALRTHRIEIVYMLLRSGGSVQIVGFNNKSCVQCARDSGLADLAKTLSNFNTSMGGAHSLSSPQLRK